MKKLICLALALSATVANAQEPVPVLKPPGPSGSCPFAYVTSGSFCVPAQGAQYAIPRPELPLGLDVERELLPAQRADALACRWQHMRWVRACNARVSEGVCRASCRTSRARAAGRRRQQRGASRAR